MGQGRLIAGTSLCWPEVVKPGEWIWQNSGYDDGTLVLQKKPGRNSVKRIFFGFGFWGQIGLGTYCVVSRSLIISVTMDDNLTFGYVLMEVKEKVMFEWHLEHRDEENAIHTGRMKLRLKVAEALGEQTFERSRRRLKVRGVQITTTRPMII